MAISDFMVVLFCFVLTKLLFKTFSLWNLKVNHSQLQVQSMINLHLYKHFCVFLFLLK